MKLKIYVLTDNVVSQKCQAEHGLSYLISFDENVLFDTGQSDLFIKNAKKIDAPLSKTKTVVLSHGHYDHGNGLKYLNNKTLICHPDAFITRYSGKQKKLVGLNFQKNDIEKNLKVITSKEPYFISKHIVYLGQIPRKHSFEKRTQRFYISNQHYDELLDDSALVIKMQQGLFIISGCAHSGICNIIDYAIEVTKEKRVFGIMGGFHLKFNNKQTQQTIEHIKKLNPLIVMPSHCTGLPALSAFHHQFKGEQVKAGALFTFDETGDT